MPHRKTLQMKPPPSHHVALIKAADETPSLPHTHSEDPVLDEMDAISAIVSVASLITCANTVVKYLYSAVQSSSKFRNELAAIAEETATILGILSAIRSTGLKIPSRSTSPESSGNSSSASESFLSDSTNTEYERISSSQTLFQLSSHLLSEIQACHQTLMEIDKQLLQATPRNGKGMHNALRKIKWAINRADIDSFLIRLQRHKLTFTLILSSHGT